MTRCIHPFTTEELRSLNSGRNWYQRLGDIMPWSERSKMLKLRQGKLVDIWNNDDPDWRLKGGGVQGWEECLEATIADGTQISNSTAETIICPDFNIPKYYLTPGRTLRIWAFGVMSNVVTTPGTFTGRVRWGGVAGTTLLASAAQGLDTTAHTNALWYMLAYVTCRTVGATGSAMSGGVWECFNLLSSTAANLLPAVLGSAGTPGTSGNAAVTIDTTTDKLLSVTGQFSVATNPTNLTAQQRIVEVLN